MSKDQEKFEAALLEAWDKVRHPSQPPVAPDEFRAAFHYGYIYGLKWSREAFKRLAPSSLAT